MNKVIKNNRASKITLGPLDGVGKGVELAPGENDVDESLWAEYKRNPAVKIWLESGCLKETRQEKARSLAVDTNITSVGDMKKAIKKCDNDRMLRMWGKTDKRKSVISAIEDRLKVLSQGGGREKEEEEVENSYDKSSRKSARASR